MFFKQCLKLLQVETQQNHSFTETNIVIFIPTKDFKAWLQDFKHKSCNASLDREIDCLY